MWKLLLLCFDNRIDDRRSSFLSLVLSTKRSDLRGWICLLVQLRTMRNRMGTKKENEVEGKWRMRTREGSPLFSRDLGSLSIVRVSSSFNRLWVEINKRYAGNRMKFSPSNWRQNNLNIIYIFYETSLRLSFFLSIYNDRYLWSTL